MLITFKYLLFEAIKVSDPKLQMQVVQLTTWGVYINMLNIDYICTFQLNFWLSPLQIILQWN